MRVSLLAEDAKAINIKKAAQAAFFMFQPANNDPSQVRAAEPIIFPEWL